MSTEFSTGAVVIGAGAVGLAIARALAQGGRETVILEKNTAIGMESSARNSEVIHAGLYYPRGSLKADLCVAGREQLYGFCQSHGVGHKKLGKLIVTTSDDQQPELEKLARRAAGNGVTDLKMLTRAEIAALEPELSVTGGLFSPSTGIIDSHAFMQALLGDAEAAGASLARNTGATAIVRHGDTYRIAARQNGQTMTLRARYVINSAGLWAPRVAGLVEGLNPHFVPPTYMAKGSYVTLMGKNPFRHLIYPVPEPGGLGVHLTLDMAGAARFGPDVEWLATDDPGAIDYATPPGLAGRMAPRIAAYWPGVAASMLAPAYAGVRPKSGGQGDPDADFRIEGDETHGMKGLVNLFGIESPGLTAALAIADKVKAMLDD